MGESSKQANHNAKWNGNIKFPTMIQIKLKSNRIVNTNQQQAIDNGWEQHN